MRAAEAAARQRAREKETKERKAKLAASKAAEERRRADPNDPSLHGPSDALRTTIPLRLADEVLVR